MKINGFAILGFLSLVSGSVARRGNRFRASADSDPLPQKSRVTAFINTDEGLRVECWELDDLAPQSRQVTLADGSKGTFSRRTMAADVSVEIFSFPPSSIIFSLGATGMHTNAIDFRAQPNLFTVKDGLIFIEARPVSGGDVATKVENWDQHVFADVNGDDWFYFEDTMTSSSSSSRKPCPKSMAESSLTARTISGSDSTLVNFVYSSTPKHTVLHEGRCNFAGLKPVSSSSQNDPDTEKIRFRFQEI